MFNAVPLLKYKASIRSVTVGGQAFELYVPDAETVKREYDLLRASGKAVDFPFWARLWPAAIALSGFIQQHQPFIAGKKVMEIAAGLGLPSLVAARSANVVRCTDIAEDAMQLAAESAAHAGLYNMHCSVLNWNDIPGNTQVDTLLLSDVNYEPEAFEALHRLLRHFLSKGVTVLLATPQRLMAVPFVNALQQFVTDQTVVTVEEGNLITSVSVYVLQQQDR